MYDVIIAGAGPAGTAAAEACARAGLSTLVVEEHGTIGYPVQCAGLLSRSALDECRVSRKSVLNSIRGAQVVSKNGERLAFDAGTEKAVVVDRGMLDAEMARKAADAGAVFRVRTAVRGIDGTTIATRGVNGREEFRFRLLVAADGPRSTVARLLKMQRARTYLAGIQAEIPYKTDRHLVTIYPDAAPDFFGYAIPSGERRTRIGLCTGEDAKGRFSRFARKFGGKNIHLVTGTLPLGVMPKTYGKHTLFTGDAAGFAKPTSGGGVYTGVRSARHAAAVAVACCESGAFDDNALAAYEQRWKEDMGKMLESGFRLFQLRRQMSGDDISRLIRAMNDPAIIDAILQYGDMDRPGLLIRRLMMKPAVLSALGSLVRPGFLSLFNNKRSGQKMD